MSVLISQSIDSLTKEPGTITITSLPSSGANAINPDPERIDPRYLLTEEETKYIFEYESALKESGYFETEAITRTKEDYTRLIHFLPSTSYDMEAYEDEIDLGIPHKEVVLTPQEKIKQEENFNLQIETFYGSAGNELENISNDDLKKALLNAGANLRILIILEESLDIDGMEKRIFKKNKDMMVYLRRRIISKMINRGIR